MPAEIYCADCGARNEADAVFCEVCGHRVDGGTAPATAAPTPATAAPAMAPQKKGMPGWVMVLGALIVLAAVARFVFPLQTAMAILAIEEKLHLGPFSGQQIASSAPDSSNATTPAAPTVPSRPVPRTDDTTMQPIQIEIDRTPSGNVVARPPVTRPNSPPPTVTVVRPISSLPTQPPPPPATPPPVTMTTGQSGNSVVLTTRDPGISVMPPAATRSIPSGSVLTLGAVEQVCTDKNKVGDRFHGTVQQEVTGANGARIAKGTQVTFMVDRLQRSDGKTPTVFTVAPESIDLENTTYTVNASLDTVVVKKKGKGLLGAIVGAVAGAAATRAAGGSSGAVIAGAAVGGTAGAVVGSHLGNEDGCIDKNALMRITLRNPLMLR